MAEGIIRTGPINASNDRHKFKHQLEKAKSEIMLRAPQHIPVARFLGAALTAVNKTPSLLSCDRVSLFQALFNSIQCGWLPDTPLQHAHLIPFSGKVMLIPGYRGLLTCAYRNPKIEHIDVRSVYENEDDGERFKVIYAPRPNIIHSPIVDSTQRGELKYVYAIAYFIGSDIPKFKVLDRWEIDRIKDKSAAVKAGKDTPWKTDYEKMSWKTALKQLFNMIPLETDLALAVDLDNKVETGESQEIAAEWADIDIINIISEEAGNGSSGQAPPEQKSEMAMKAGDPGDHQNIKAELKPLDTDRKNTLREQLKVRDFAGHGELGQHIQDALTAKKVDLAQVDKLIKKLTALPKMKAETSEAEPPEDKPLDDNY